jgi:hypothetical protein
MTNWQMVGDVPRRCREDLVTPAERAIFVAIRAVEAMWADERLTRAQVLLDDARNLVADAVERRPRAEAS